jgi:uncharacterized FlgJ-related protein
MVEPDGIELSRIIVGMATDESGWADTRLASERNRLVVTLQSGNEYFAIQ